MLDICLIGLGAIGTVYAWALERSGKARVTAVCRSNYETVSAHGLNITSDKLGTVQHWKPYRVVSRAADAADRDYAFVVCAFKCLPDVTPTPALIEPLLAKTSAFVLIQNGVGIEVDLQQRVSKSTIISGCAWIDATDVDDGRAVSQTGEEWLTIGFHRPPSTWTSAFSDADAQSSLGLLNDLLRSGGVTPESTSRIEAARWRKVLWNAAFSTICTLTRGSMADIMSSSILDDMLPVVRGVMNEVIYVARLTGITEDELPQSVPEAVIRGALQTYSDAYVIGVPSTFKPSMLVDLEAGRPIEVEAIIGGVVRKARQVGAVDIPRLEMVYASLKVIQRKTLIARARKS